jgi:superfamily I DNA/RNA helicase
MPTTTLVNWHDNLEGAPRRIAETDRSPLRVLAGPGTGKTFALMRRVARLLQNGVDAERVLVSTFTRTAATDLAKELAALGIEGVDDVRAGTLHSLCFSILSRADVLELTGRVPRPLLDFESRFLLEDVKGEPTGGIRACDKRLQAFNAAWARLQSEEPGWPTEPADLAFHQSLLAWLRFHAAMLIGELVPETLRFLRDNPASPYANQFDHVLVDEYQDLNRAEQVLLDLLAEDGMLAVIGDEDQSIYSFKHAHPEGISTFHETHSDTCDDSLDECRRCPLLVVEMANALIRNNASRVDRELRPRADNPAGEVHVVQWTSMEDEAQGIAQFIQERVQSDEVEPGRILMLAPRRQFGYGVRNALNSIGVLSHSFFHEEAFDGDPTELDKSPAQQAFTLLTLLVDPHDRVALRCWCGFGSPSLRSGAWTRLRRHCEQTGESPRTAIERLAAGQLALPGTGDLVERFRLLQDRLGAFDGMQGQALVDALFPTGESWAGPFRSLATLIQGDDFRAEELRQLLQARITQPELPTDVDYVRVMSLHKSKGLTADLVVVMGCVEGLLPTVEDGLSTEESNRKLEEQRRLFYVAITRTRQTLILSSVTRLPRDLAFRMGARVTGGNRSHANTIASGFLNELGSSRPRAVLGSTILRNALL